jgi:succinoglycan biosynthesis transport protein ExoP
LPQVGDAGLSYDAASPQPPWTELFATLVGFIRRQLFVVLSVALLTIGLAAVYLFTTPPLYSGQTKLLIDSGRVQVVKPADSILADPENALMVDNQIEILKSEKLALTSLKNLHLTRDPEFIGPAGGLIGIANDLISNLFTAKPQSEADLTRRALRAFERQLTVTHVPMTSVIEIEFQSIDPDRAAQIANAVADGFIVDQRESRYQTIASATVWLQDRLKELQGQAAAAERAVVDYKTKNNIVDTGGLLMDQEQVTELNTALVQARAATAEAQARFNSATEAVREDNTDTGGSIDLYSPEHTNDRSGHASVTDTLQNAVITQLRQQYLELAQREALFASRYGANHLAVVNLRNRMQEIHRSIVSEIKQIADAYKSDYEIANARQNSLEKELAATVVGSQTTDKARIELHQLESAAQTYRTLYDSFQQRYTDSVQEQLFPVTQARIITRASRPMAPSSPQSLKILAVATMGGLVLGLGLAILREISDRVFRTGKQVETQLNTGCLAMVPLIKNGATAPRIAANAGWFQNVIDALVAKKGAKAAPVSTKESAAIASRIITPNACLFRNVIDAPLSPFTESIRAVKVSVDVPGAAKSNKVIGITSSHPNEGKSTIAASLAQLIAHTGARVILVDCDLRKPSLSRELVPNRTGGLIDVITNKASLDELIWSDPSTGLSFLPAGVKSHLIHTNETLASDAMKVLFVRLRENYDYVIVDLSPIAPVVDVRSATHLADAFVFIIEWGKTKMEVVEHALHTAQGVYDNLLGVVLNKVELRALNRYEGHGNYYHSRHFASYDYTV